MYKYDTLGDVEKSTYINLVILDDGKATTVGQAVRQANGDWQAREILLPSNAMPHSFPTKDEAINYLKELTINKLVHVLDGLQRNSQYRGVTP